MKSKTPLALMEQVAMVLVFALAAAVCLRAFVLSDRLSRQYALRDEAVLAAQNAAETLKSCAGDYAQAARLLGGSWSGEMLSVDTDGALCVLAYPENSGSPLLGMSRIEVCAVGDDEPLFALTIAWQEVDGHG